MWNVQLLLFRTRDVVCMHSWYSTLGTFQEKSMHFNWNIWSFYHFNFPFLMHKTKPHVLNSLFKVKEFCKRIHTDVNEVLNTSPWARKQNSVNTDCEIEPPFYESYYVRVVDIQCPGLDRGNRHHFVEHPRFDTTTRSIIQQGVSQLWNDHSV